MPPAMRRNSYERWIRDGHRRLDRPPDGMMFAASPLTPPEAVEEIVDIQIHRRTFFDPGDISRFCFVVARNPQSSPAAIRKAVTFYAEEFGGMPRPFVEALMDRYSARAQTACKACEALRPAPLAARTTSAAPDRASTTG